MVSEEPSEWVSEELPKFSGQGYQKTTVLFFWNILILFKSITILPIK